MSRNILNIRLSLLLNMIFLLSLSSQLNLNILYNFLTEKGYSQTEIEHIEVLEMLGLMIVSLILVQIINLISKKKIIILFFTLLIIGKFNIIFLEDYNLVKIYFMIVSGCIFSLLIIYFLLSIEHLANYPYFSIIIPLLVMICARIIGEYISPNLLHLSSNNYEILNILLSVVLLTLCFFWRRFSSVKTLFKMNIVKIVKNIEFELMLAFILGYINTAIYWEYEVFAIAENLGMKDVGEVRHHILLSVILLALPLQIIIKKFDRQIINSIALISLITSILTLKYIGSDRALNLLLVYVIGFSLSLILINNLMTLVKKFEGENLRTAISFYCSLLASGSYVGIVLSEETVNKIGEWGFIYAICFVSGLFLIYYLFQFKQVQTKT